jgi:hypothetical protein
MSTAQAAGRTDMLCNIMLQQNVVMNTAGGGWWTGQLQPASVCCWYQSSTNFQAYHCNICPSTSAKGHICSEALTQLFLSRCTGAALVWPTAGVLMQETASPMKQDNLEMT